MTEITPDQARLDSLHQIVLTWTWAIDNPDGVPLLRHARLDGVRDIVRRERAVLKDCGLTGETYDWTMRWSVYVLSALDELIRDRENELSIFLEPG